MSDLQIVWLLELLCNSTFKDFHIVAGRTPCSSNRNSTTSPIMLLQLQRGAWTNNKRTHSGWVSKDFVKRKGKKVRLSFCKVQRMTCSKLGGIHQHPPILQFSFTTCHLLCPFPRKNLTCKVLLCWICKPGCWLLASTGKEKNKFTASGSAVKKYILAENPSLSPAYLTVGEG